MLSVIIPSYRNPKYLDLCLKSLTEGMTEAHEVIVTLDGYVEESEEIVKKYAGVDVIPLEENRGMQTAINLAVWNAHSEKILIINDDNVFPKNWDTRIESQYHPNTIFTINQIEPTGPGMFNFPVYDCGQTADTFDMQKFQMVETKLSKHHVTNDGNIFPFLINKRWFMAVGGFDTFYDSPNLCDWDFFLKLELLKPTIGYARLHHVHLYHFGSVSTKKNAESASFIQREQYAVQQFKYKWGMDPYNGMNNTKLPPLGVHAVRGI